MKPRAKISVVCVASVVLVVLCFVVAPHFFVRASAYSPMNACMNNLRQIEAAKDQWALEHGKTTNDIPTWDDLRPYFPKDIPSSKDWRDGQPICPERGSYTIGRVGQLPKCTIRYHTLDPALMP